MTTATAPDPTVWEVERASSKWWLLLISGIAWILISIVVLDFDWDSAATIGFLVGVYLILAGITEFMLLTVVDGWKWVHVVLGVLFVLGGLAAFTAPLQTFGILARWFAFFLLLKGTFDLVAGLASRHEVDLWWLLMLAGIFEIVIAFWASSYPGRSATLLVLWVGIGAVVRGVTHLVMAFQVRKLHEAVEAVA